MSSPIKIGSIVQSSDYNGLFTAKVVAINHCGIAYAVREMGDCFRGYNIQIDSGKSRRENSGKVFKVIW